MAVSKDVRNRRSVKNPARQSRERPGATARSNKRANPYGDQYLRPQSKLLISRSVQINAPIFSRGLVNKEDATKIGYGAQGVETSKWRLVERGDLWCA